MRTITFQFTITCSSPGTADLRRVEELIDLNMQDLCFDDHFISALDEQESVTIQTVLVK